MSKSEKKREPRTGKVEPVQPAPEPSAKDSTAADEPSPVTPAQDSTASDPGPRHDQRFDAAEWQQWPYKLIYRNFLLTQRFWLDATKGIHGLSRREEQALTTALQQAFDMMSPSNMPWTNPEVIGRTVQEGVEEFAAGGGGGGEAGFQLIAEGHQC